MQRQYTPPCAGRIDDRLVCLDRAGHGQMEAMTLRWQQVVVDGLAHQVMPESQLTRGGTEDVVIDGLAQGVLDLG